MSDDELSICGIAGVAALGIWGFWFYEVLACSLRGSPRSARPPLALAPALGAMLLYTVLARFAAEDVRNSGSYILFYLVLGAAWVGFSALFLTYLGVSPRDDALERGNSAAASTVAGGVLGLTFAYAGGNIGNGPGWWVVVFAAALATGGLFLLGLAVAKTTEVVDAVVIDRDEAAGLRLGALLAAGGLVLGRAVAGDWISIDATIVDFVRQGWPVFFLVVAEVGVEAHARPTPQAPVAPILPYGWLPAAAYVMGAAWYVLQLGSWAVK